MHTEHARVEPVLSGWLHIFCELTIQLQFASEPHPTLYDGMCERTLYGWC
jgi:hypothetical protein